VIGTLNQLLILVKALPLAYNRDLQEDKAALFDAFDTVVGCLAVAAPMVEQTKLRREVIASRIEDGFLDATTLMEALIAAGVPMRSAHEAVGTLVKQCEQRKCRLADLPAEAFETAAPGAGAVREKLGVANAVAAFQSYGSTAPAEVKKQLAAWKQRV
jgi:argininosuccinate lyase